MAGWMRTRRGGGRKQNKRKSGRRGVRGQWPVLCSPKLLVLGPCRPWAPWLSLPSPLSLPSCRILGILLSVVPTQLPSEGHGGPLLPSLHHGRVPRPPAPTLHQLFALMQSLIPAGSVARGFSPEGQTALDTKLSLLLSSFPSCGSSFSLKTFFLVSGLIFMASLDFFVVLLFLFLQM